MDSSLTLLRRQLSFESCIAGSNPDHVALSGGWHPMALGTRRFSWACRLGPFPLDLFSFLEQRTPVREEDYLIEDETKDNIAELGDGKPRFMFMY
jgi:hypothetical protein